uniref:Uncharacterized protein n=1 Tax=Oncorhynchus tshawytscha TaxID=74940 RepID=A0A8C8ILF3_ONCTS
VTAQRVTIQLMVKDLSWRKVLCDRQSFPDNYVDRRFMEELRRNEGLHLYRCWAVVQEAGLVAQHLLCGSVPHFLNPIFLLSTLLWSGLLCALLDSHQCTRWSDVKSASIFTFGFSPVLRSLRVRQYRHGYAMTALMLVAFPYTQTTPPLSMLPCSPQSAWPLPSPPRGAWTPLLHTFSMLCWVQFIKLQSDKDNIQGPWDEAEIQEDLTHFLSTLMGKDQGERTGGASHTHTLIH